VGEWREGDEARAELESIAASLAAGAAFALGQMFGAAAFGESPLLPVEMAASVFLGREAFALPLVIVVPLAVAIHAALSVLFGFLYGHLMSLFGPAARRGAGRQALLGIAYGTYPWIHDTPALAQWAAHAFLFGLPLALGFAAQEREAPTPTPTPSRRAPPRTDRRSGPSRGAA
jgi:hypothetical protein